MYVHFFKRGLDLVISILVMPFLLLLTAILAPIIYFEDKGPVFYNAPRVGKNGKEFIMYKFRSMKVNAPDLTMADGSTYNGADDPRMTKIGAFMRRTSLDEFPQFLNVLIGNMSVIGPRPDLKRETELYEGNEEEKLLVKPGITGYAAAYGRNSLPWHDRLKMDVHYVHNVSFGFDVKICFKTIATVFKQEGVYVEQDKKDEG
ncbi:sugar transferase [Slackia piriformis]|uniref:sugar transferase n=1 Tax=Slackia piriformis TaxID=626934 RepID=UPI0023F4AD25|nr:sugar transferase [Slackia piriformis]